MNWPSFATAVALAVTFASASVLNAIRHGGEAGAWTAVAALAGFAFAFFSSQLNQPQPKEESEDMP